MMTGDQIRELFLAFFAAREHQRMPSASLVPSGDSTLLFTSAGMVPFKPFFMGEEPPPSRRLVSSQKSFRTTDIDEVGDHKHLTFFEMLGNFSIGDYFKEEAIRLAWEFVTSTGEGLGLSADRFYATIYQDDDEAYEYWKSDIGLSPDRIYRYGTEDNWWGPAGLEGPCGPCSELHYDFGAGHGCGQPLRESWRDGEGCHPNHDCERFIELWNLVFMQYYQDSQAERTPLPAPSVDTGMGLERAAFVMQEGSNIYDTDLFLPLISIVSELSKMRYGQDRETDYGLRVVAEHSRAAVFLIADGVVPGNEGRGYVLRRVIRRAIRYGRRLGMKESFLTDVANIAIQRFSKAYPDLAKSEGFILRVIGLEEEGFGRTVERGTRILNGMVAYRVHVGLAFPFPSSRGQFQVPPPDSDADQQEQIGQGIAANCLSVLFGPHDTASEDQSLQARQRLKLDVDTWRNNISGDEGFLLWDTYGFPLEETAAIAKESYLEVDLEGFKRKLETHRRESRAARVTTGGMGQHGTYEELAIRNVEFVGYQRLEQTSTVTALLVDGISVCHAAEGQRVEVILQKTSFYAEGGGQIGDSGTIIGPNGVVNVEDVQSPIAGLIVHKSIVSEGSIAVGDLVEARVNPARRIDTARNHSGTHLLHASLRQILGAHVRQAGSLVSADRLRFDYTHVGPVGRGELKDIQSIANGKMWANLEVDTHETTYDQAVRDGALAFFGDKYGEKIRVVTMLDKPDGQSFSMEVCGGTHVGTTGQVGPMWILGDSGIGGGMRRIEAVTGRAAQELALERFDLLQSLSKRLETPVSDLEKRLENFLSEINQLRKHVVTLEHEALKTESQELILQVQLVGDVKVLAAKTSATTIEALREMGDRIKANLSSVVLVLALVQNDSLLLISMVTEDLVQKGFHAGDIVREVAQMLGGSGGGRAEIAQAGGKKLDKLPEALALVTEIIRRG